MHAPGEETAALSRSRIDAQEQDLARLIQAEPERADLRREYGVLLFRRRLFREAAAEFSHWARVAPGDPDSFLCLARALACLRIYEYADFARAAAETAQQDPARAATATRVLARLERWQTQGIQTQGIQTQGIQTQGMDVRAGRDAIDEGPSLQQQDGPTQPFEPTRRDLRARGRNRHRARHPLVTALDAMLDFFDLLRALVLRNIAFYAKNNPVKLFDASLMMAIIIVCHTVLFFFTGRSFPGQISLLGATLAGFVNWTCFSRVRSRAAPFGANSAYNRSANTKWVHLFVADALWDVLMITLVSFVVMAFGHLYLPSMVAAPMPAPNIPLLFAVISVSAVIGAGVGLTVEGLEERWPFSASVCHIMLWLMYFSCGIYGAYVLQPDFLAPYLRINPLLSVTEYARLGFDRTYPVGDLTLLYPSLAGLGFLALGLLIKNQSEGHPHQIATVADDR